MEFRSLAQELADAARQGDKEALQQRVYYLIQTMAAAHKLAPFESPRFAAVDYAPREADLSQVTTDELDTLEKLLSRAFGFADQDKDDAATTQH